MNYNLRQAQIIGSIGTAVFVILLLLLLLLVKMRHDIIDPPVNQVEVEMDMGDLGGTFGDGADGTPAPEVTTPPVEPITEPTPKPAPPAEPVMTQEDPSVVAARAEKKKAEEKRRQELAAEKAAKAAEQARIAAEQKAAAEKKAKEDKARALTAGAFGKGGTSTSGNGPGGDGTGLKPGNPLGKGKNNPKGVNIGRDVTNGTFFKPAYNADQEGKIVIRITVDKQGNVIGTDIIQGTTISDEALRNESKAMARKTKFNADPKAPEKQYGTITYEFKKR